MNRLQSDQTSMLSLYLCQRIPYPEKRSNTRMCSVSRSPAPGSAEEAAVRRVSDSTALVQSLAALTATW